MDACVITEPDCRTHGSSGRFLTGEYVGGKGQVMGKAKKWVIEGEGVAGSGSLPSKVK